MSRLQELKEALRSTTHMILKESALRFWYSDELENVKAMNHVATELRRLEFRLFGEEKPTKAELKPPQDADRHPARCPAGMNCQWSKAMYDSCPQCGYEGDSPKEQS